MISSSFALRRWLAHEILGKDIGRKPVARASALSKKPPRNARYRAWIRSLPCLVCDTTIGVEAAHTGPHGFGEKASDFTCIPLCREHHRTGNEALDKIGREAFESKFQVSIQEVCPALVSRYRGWLARIEDRGSLLL